MDVEDEKDEDMREVDVESATSPRRQDGELQHAVHVDVPVEVAVDREEKLDDDAVDRSATAAAAGKGSGRRES